VKENAMPKRDCLTCLVRGPNGFCHLPTDAITSLQAIGRSRRLARGEQLFQEGESGDHVYLICHGQLKLTASSSDGRLLIVRIANAGDVLGLAAVLRGSQQRLSAEALAPCEIKSIGRADFMRFTERFQAVGLNTSQAAAREYEGAILTARRLALSGSASGKLASVLIELAQGSSPDGSTTREFPMSLTHEELGNMAGLSRETVTRLLVKFRGEGLVEQNRGLMQLPQPGRLESLFQ
jgi:CRP/FNR family cyclic AMP-dependent transcriptional regulator